MFQLLLQKDGKKICVDAYKRLLHIKSNNLNLNVKPPESGSKVTDSGYNTGNDH